MLLNTPISSSYVFHFVGTNLLCHLRLRLILGEKKYDIQKLSISQGKKKK